MIRLRPLLVLLLFIAFFSTTGCSKYTPVEPSINTGTVFHRSIDVVRDAARNALTNLSFGITQENDEYLEAVHLKPGETIEDNDGELVGIWLKQRDDAVVVLISTKLRPSGIAKQRNWDEDVTREIIAELQ